LKSKEFLTGVFSRNAPAYRERLEEAMRKGQAAGRDAILDYLKPRPGMRILDLACGPGTLTIPIAKDLNGGGEGIGIDLAEGVLSGARPSRAVDAFRKAIDKRLGPAPGQPELAETRAILSDLDRFAAAALAAGFRFAETERVEVETSWDGPGHYAAVNSSWWAFAARLEGLSEHVRQMVVDEGADAVRQVTGDAPFLAPAAAHVLRAEA